MLGTQIRAGWRARTATWRLHNTTNFHHASLAHEYTRLTLGYRTFKCPIHVTNFATAAETPRNSHILQLTSTDAEWTRVCHNAYMVLTWRDYLLVGPQSSTRVIVCFEKVGHDVRVQAHQVVCEQEDALYELCKQKPYVVDSQRFRFHSDISSRDRGFRLLGKLLQHKPSCSIMSSDGRCRHLPPNRALQTANDSQQTLHYFGGRAKSKTEDNLTHQSSHKSDQEARCVLCWVQYATQKLDARTRQDFTDACCRHELVSVLVVLVVRVVLAMDGVSGVGVAMCLAVVATINHSCK